MVWGESRAVKRLTAALIALTWLCGIVAVATHADAAKPVRAVAPPTTTTSSTSTTTTSTSTTTTTEPPTTEPPTTAPPPPPPPPTTVAPAVAAPAPLTPSGTWTMDAYTGLGSWVDVYDWSETYGGGAFGLADVDRMASLGVQTMFIQATRWDAETVILEPDRLLSLVNRAHHDGVRVVAWYLPDLGDPNDDLQRLDAIAQLPIDGLGVDIESRKVSDVDDRNQRLLDLSATVRAQLPGQVLSAIVLPPVVMEDVNPNYWPGYPWAGLAQYYDVWQPMSYWTNRKPEWRDANLYTATNIDRIRQHIGNPDAPVATIGGIGDQSTPEDIAGMQQACAERGCLGASIYDYRTTGDDLWPQLQQSRA